MRVIQFHFFHVNICFAFVASAIAYLRFKKIRAAVLSLIAVTILQYLSYTKLKGMVPFAPFEGAWHTKQYLAIALTLLWGGVLLWGVLTAEISAKMKVCVLTLLAIAFAYRLGLKSSHHDALRVSFGRTGNGNIRAKLLQPG